MRVLRRVLLCAALPAALRAGEIHQAAARGDIPLLTAVASRGPAARASTDTDGYTALHLAVIHRQPEAVRVLLAAGAPIEARDREGNTPLHHLAHSAEESVARNFQSVTTGAFAEALERLASGGQGLTPAALLSLLRADLADEEDPLKLLRNFAAETSPEQLDAELKCAQALVAAGADLEAVNAERSTPLHHAARSPWPDLARVLLEAGAKVNAQNSAGFTPLHHAALFGSPGTVEYLLKAGADPDGRSGLLGVPPLVMAATRGERRSVALLVEHRADVNALAGNGETALSRAAFLGAADVVKLLLESGARVNVRFGKQNQTPLHAVAARGHLQIIEMLLARGADADARDQANFTPLMLAADKGHTLALRLLRLAGASVEAANDVGRTALWLAAARGHAESVAYLINHGANPLSAAADGQNALHIAAFNARPGALRMLLDRKPDLAAASRIGTPLHSAAAGPTLRAFFATQLKPGQKPPAGGSAEDTLACARLLLAAGAPLDIEDANHANPLQAAAAFGNKALLELLVTDRRDAARAADSHGLTALHHAARGPLIPGYTERMQPVFPAEILAGCGETAALLISLGVPVNAHDKSGLTALHHAAASGNVPVLQALLAAGADLKAVDRTGGTPLHTAAAHGRTDSVAALLAARASLRAGDSEGQTPLHVAVHGGKSTVVRLLLKSGADPNAKTRRGQTPLSLAVTQKHTDLVRLLRDNGAKAPETN